MSELQAELALGADLSKIRRLASERGWKVGRRRGLAVDVTLRSRIDAEAYTLRLVGPGYPDSALSIKPIDPVSGSSDIRSAWPDCDGFRATTDLCLPLSAEGYAVHPEWQKDRVLRWNSGGNPLLRVLEELQILLDNPARYRGRLG